MNYLQKLLLFVHFIFHGISRHVLPSSLELYPCGARARFRSVARAFWFHRPLPVLRSLQRERGKREFIYCFFFFQPVSFSGSVLNFQNCIWGGGGGICRGCHITLWEREREGEEFFPHRKRDFNRKQKVQKKEKNSTSTLSFFSFSFTSSLSFALSILHSLLFSLPVNCGDEPRTLPPSHLATLKRKDERRRERGSLAAAASRRCRRRLDLDPHRLDSAPVAPVEHSRYSRPGPQELRERCC